MDRALLTVPRIEPRGDLVVNVASWRRHLRASNLSPNTVRTYLDSLDRFATFLDEQGMPADISGIRREHVEAFVQSLLERWKPTTAANRYVALNVFFRWAVEEAEIRESPMAKMRKPRLPELELGVLDETKLRAVVAACEGLAFEDRRDMALIRTFIGTGARLSEIANMRWAPTDPASNDLDLDMGLIRVMGKGRRERTVYVGVKAVKALDRYVRLRDRHQFSRLPWLWLSRKGRLSVSGVGQAIRERGAVAGVAGLHAHQFRHSYAHAMLAAGMQEGDLMQLAGWRSREMLGRYAAATRSDRAIAAARRLNPGDAL
jgi:site-specific recombinase XerD